MIYTSVRLSTGQHSSRVDGGAIKLRRKKMKKCIKIHYGHHFGVQDMTSESLLLLPRTKDRRPRRPVSTPQYMVDSPSACSAPMRFQRESVEAMSCLLTTRNGRYSGAWRTG